MKSGSLNDENKSVKRALSEPGYLANLFVFYFIAQGGILLIPNAIFWDDWSLYGVSSQAIYKTFDMAGSVLNIAGHVHVAMLAIGPWLYRVLTFVLMFASGLLLWQILKRQPWISIDVRYAIVLLFLVLPLNAARAALIAFPGRTGYFLFFLAWYFLGKNRILALGLFFLSFNINSMLVFYALPMAEWYFRDGNRLKLITAWRWTIRRIDFVILPFVFWFIKTAYFKPHGDYAGYNEDFTFKPLITGPLYMGYDLAGLEIRAGLLIILLVFVYSFIKKSSLDDRNYQIRILVVGVAAFVAAVFPYLIVGHVPIFDGWVSRHQLLMPLGTALLLVWLLMRIPFEIRRGALILLVASSLALNLQIYFAFYQDWGKQQELVSLFSQNEQIRAARLVVFDDRTENALKRRYRFYEWNGLMKLAYGDETRFGLARQDLDLYLREGSERYFTDSYSAKDHVRESNPKEAIVKIERTSSPPGLYHRFMWIIGREPQYSLSVN